MDWKELIGYFFLAIIVIDILTHGSDANTILGTAGTQLNTLTKTLEGR